MKMKVKKNKNNNLTLKDFKKIFYLKEGKELAGKKLSNLWILIIIFFITFCAIGFGNGSLEYLRYKMSDPFVNWVTVNIPSKQDDEIQQISQDLNYNQALKDSFSYKNVVGFNRFMLYFWDEQEKATLGSIGRTIDIKSPLLNKILNKNKVKGRGFKNEEDIGLIVTENFLKKFHYKDNISYVKMSMPVEGNKDKPIPLPVIAVVKELPGLNMFATTPYFYDQRKIQYRGNPFNPNKSQYLILFTSADSIKTYLLKDSITSFFEHNHEYQKLDPITNIFENNYSYIQGYNISTSFYPKPSFNKLDSIYERLVNSKELKPFSTNFIRFYSYNVYEQSPYINYGQLSVNFVKLDKVRSFRDYIYKKYKLNIDMNQILSKENYYFVSRLSVIISFILIFFSILSICMFVSNLLKTHLEKIKMNIGTFKAFGMDDKTLQWIYIKLLTGFILFSMLVSVLISEIFGALGGIRLILKILNISIEHGQNYFQLFSNWTLISILSILIVSFIVLYCVAHKILNKTPGDLIYNRE